MNIMGKEYNIYAARGNGKSNIWVQNFLMHLATVRKKKKSFLKFLQAMGFKRSVLNAYEDYIKDGKGSRSYSWMSFQYYILTNYCSCERR